MSSFTPDPARGQRVHDLDRAHVFHSWSAQAALNPMVFAGGEGSYVWDFDGTRYLDFSSQLVNTNIGHQHPAVVAATVTCLRNQVGRGPMPAYVHACSGWTPSCAPASYPARAVSDHGACVNQARSILQILAMEQSICVNEVRGERRVCVCVYVCLPT